VTRETPANGVFVVCVESQAQGAKEVTVARRATRASVAKRVRRVKEVRKARSAPVGKKEVTGKRVPKAHLDPKVFVAKKVTRETEEKQGRKD
jgi:P2-related tail formation protein